MIVVIYYYIRGIVAMMIPMDVTSLPIVTDVKDLHPSKAESACD